MGIINTYCRISVCLLLLTMSGFSCSTSKANYAAEVSVKDEIVFVVFKISRDTIRQKTSIQVLEKIKSDGTFKGDVVSNWTSGNFLTFEVYEKGKQIRNFTMEHPLYKGVEYAEDDIMISKQLSLTEEDFFIRIQTTTPDTKLKVYETLDGKGKNELISIKL